MNLEDLQSILSSERQTDSVQPLPGSFYEEVGAHLAELRGERERIAAEQGFDDPEFRRLSDEIDAVEDTVESIYERRVGKVVKAASIAASGMPAEDNGLTDEERALFEALVTEIAENREQVLDVLAEEPPAQSNERAEPATPDPLAVTPDDPPPDQTSEGDTDRSAPPTPTPDDPDGPPEDDDGPETRSVDSRDLSRTMIQITRDVGEILGVDERAYDLAQGDVVTLPTENAGPLLERNAAERLD